MWNAASLADASVHDRSIRVLDTALAVRSIGVAGAVGSSGSDASGMAPDARRRSSTTTSIVPVVAPTRSRFAAVVQGPLAVLAKGAPNAASAVAR